MLLLLALAPPLGAQAGDARRGEAIFLATRDSLPAHVGNRLRCGSCHLDGGRRAGALPLGGVAEAYPRVTTREGRAISLEERVNHCLVRSMAGHPLAGTDGAMADLLAFLRAMPPTPAIERGARLEHTSEDTLLGRRVIAERCAACHGPEGLGQLAPPLWGPGSFGIGAGLATPSRLAAFIHRNMPLGAATLSEEEAAAVARLLSRRPRPDTPGKERDFPHGDPPPDLPYAVNSTSAKASSR